MKYTLLSREIHFRLTCIRDSVDVTTRSALFYRKDRMKHDVGNLAGIIFRVDVIPVNSDLVIKGLIFDILIVSL